MPKPTPRAYDPQSLGADCDNCPLQCKGMLPVPPKIALRGRATIVIEHPSPQSKYSGVALEGRASELLLSDLGASGLEGADLSAVYRIACCPPPNKTTDSILGRAAKACRPRVETELARCKGPRLYLGKWSPKGIFPGGDFPERVEISMARNVWHRESMVLTHPSIAYFHAPARRAQYRSDLLRFCQLVRGELRWPSWPTEDIILGASPECLAAMRALGPVVAADVETLGVDPLSSPITAIGLSDGSKTVSFLWASYSNRHGSYTGIETSSDPLDVAIRAELKSVLESRRIIAHNASYDLMAFEQLGIFIPQASVDDTMDASKILDPELPGGLEEAAARHLVLPERWKTIFRAGRDDDAKGGAEFAESPLEKLLSYNARDALVTAWLWDALEAKLAEED